MSTYAKIVDGAISHLGPRPAWRIGDTDEDARPLTDAELAEHGWYLVLNAPEYDSEIEKLEQIPLEEWPIGEGVVGPQFRVEALSAEELAAYFEQLKAAKREAVRLHQAELFNGGWAHQFSVGAHTLDLRDADDKTNWHLMLSRTDRMIVAGAGDALVQLRTAANETIEIPATEANAAMLDLLDWGSAMLQAKWVLDETIAAAGDRAALNGIDIAQGWPA